MHKLLSCVSAVGLALTALIALPASASANNDPHRFWLEATEMTLGTDFCAFPVTMTYTLNNEYATETDLPDGTVVLKVTGGLHVIVTNTVTRASTSVNASGPGTFAFYPDGTASILIGHGVSLFFAPNLTAFGYPSNLIQVANSGGPITLVLATHTALEMPRSIHVLRDICAELS